MKINKKLKVVSLTTLAAACVLSGAFALNANTAAAAEDTFHEVGASIRVANDKGIRFAFGLPEEYTGEGYEIGTLIIPKEVLGADVLNHNDDTADETDVDYLPIACDKNFLPSDKVKGAKEGYKYYNAALTEIPEVNYNTVLVARSYYKNANGEYFYSDVVERSIGYVASAVLNDGYNDTTGIVSAIAKQGFGDATVEVDFDIFNNPQTIKVGETTELVTKNEKSYKAIWSSSNETVATVDKNGVVTGKKGGEATITAKIGDKEETQKIYVVGNGLYSDQIGTRSNGWIQTNEPTRFDIEDSNGELKVTTKLTSSDKYYPMLMLRSMYSKEYYQALVANGYAKLTFNLTVGGENAADVSDLYVFGQALTSFPQNSDGSYAVYVDVQYIVDYYDNIYGLATSTNQAGQFGSLDKMFLAWEAPQEWNHTRNYEFTFSGARFAKGLYGDAQFVVTAYGNAIGKPTEYIKVDSGNNGEYVISAKFAGDPSNYPSVALRNLESKEYYQNLLNEGYGRMTFDIAVGGTDAANVSDLYVFGNSLTSMAKNADGSYKAFLDLNVLVNNYDVITKLGANKDATASKLNRMFIAWKTPADTWTTRNYVFTVSNVHFEEKMPVGVVINGWNQATTKFVHTEITNNEMIVSVALQDITGAYSAVVFRNLESKAYYQGLIDGGYEKLTFKLKVGGEHAQYVGGLWVFGKVLTDFEQDENGAYIIDISLQHIVDNYDGLTTAGVSVSAGKNTQYMLIAWKGVNNNWSYRYYTFTFSNPELA